MDMEGYPLENMANVCNETGHENTGYFPDPTNAENSVLGTRKCAQTGKYADIRAVMNYTPNAVEFDFDVYRTDKKADFEIKLFANSGGASGSSASLFKMDTNGNILLGGKTCTKYDDLKWYSVRIKSNKAKTYHEVYFKKKNESSYLFIGSVRNAYLGFRSDLYVHYFMKNSSDGYVYLDNMSWTELSEDLSKKVRYEFDDVEDKTGKYYELGINSENMKWSAAKFDGEKTLKSTLNETSDREVYNWEDVPDMERVYVEAAMGFDSEGNETVYLPFQFGIRPVFAEADGTKSATARNNMSEGIRFAWSRHVMLEGAVQDKSLGASLSDGKLYKAGYMYDRVSKTFKAYFIAANGKTFVSDASANKYVQDGRYLAGIKLYQRASGNYKTGSGYYDHLYIDEADKMQVQNITPQSNERDINLNSEITLTYNYIIDPECTPSVTLISAQGEKVSDNVETQFGNKLVINPNENLKSQRLYTVSVSGVCDLLGQAADDYTSSFMTSSAFTVSGVLINSGDKLTDGSNRIEFQVNSNDGMSYTVTAMVVLFDSKTGELLNSSGKRVEIGADEFKTLSVDIDAGTYKDCFAELYIWSGLGSMKPFSKIQTFTK